VRVIAIIGAAAQTRRNGLPHPALGVVLDQSTGQLLGSGATPEQALHAIGSTAEGVANTAVALGLAERHSVHLPTARAIDLALHQRLTGEHGLARLRRMFVTAMRSGAHQAARR
jgi:hypothetical protein